MSYQFSVESSQPVKNFRRFFEQFGIDVLPRLDFWQAMALSHFIVVWQAVIPAPHNINCSQISPGEFHGPEKHISHIRTQNIVLTLTNLTGKSHQDFFKRFRVKCVLKNKLKKLETSLKVHIMYIQNVHTLGYPETMHPCTVMRLIHF